LVATTKSSKDIIVLLLWKGYIKLKKQENTSWGTFVLEKKKYNVYLLSIFDGADCFFLTIRWVKVKIYLRKYSNNSKSKSIELNKVFEKLEKKEKINNIAKKNMRKGLEKYIYFYIFIYFRKWTLQKMKKLWKIIWLVITIMMLIKMKELYFQIINQRKI
jgi:hypothetical protein